MYIANVDEIIPILRGRLEDYLLLQEIITSGQKTFCCPVHEDKTPSMTLNPKTNYENAHCFSCGANIDIFQAASIYESLPSSGPKWITETIPYLADLLDIPIQAGDPTTYDKEKLRLYKLAQDIADIIESPEYIPKDYLEERKWENPHCNISSISEGTLINKLTDKGWSLQEINNSLMVRTSTFSFFGSNKITFTIRDVRGRPLGFISRNLSGPGPKYINTTETAIFEKRNILLGLDKALKAAKVNGLYIVEGPGDLQQLLRLGVANAVAICGTALTEEHLNKLKMFGIKDIYLCLDWDQAGTLATSRIFETTLRNSPGLNFWIVSAPTDMGDKTDPDAYLIDKNDPQAFTTLVKVSAFEWVALNCSDNDSPDVVCQRMVPIIASEAAAVRRELLTKKLQEITGISYQSISSDVSSVRNNSYEERQGRLLAAADKYRIEVERNPDNISAALAQHETDIRLIEQEYERDLVGATYQLSRYDALQEYKKSEATGYFKTNYLTYFTEVLRGGMGYTSGTVFYIGGRANSGKTATCLLYGLDVCMADEDAIVIIHSTDDSYIQIEPRLKTNIATIMNQGPSHGLSIGMAANPQDNIQNTKGWAAYNTASSALRDLIAEERLAVIDSEDGPTLSTLERTMRYMRYRYPNKKMLVIGDNSHNYVDFMNLDQTARMTRIANGQKHLAIKYRACMFATAEYRKNMPLDQSKIKFPVNDDIADARALMYRANAIIHVYNDLNDRGEYAEFFWTDPSDPETPLPRLSLMFGKNKITSFKKSLTLDLDPKTVSMKQISTEVKKKEYEEYVNGDSSLAGDSKVVINATDWESQESH